MTKSPCLAGAAAVLAAYLIVLGGGRGAVPPAYAHDEHAAHQTFSAGEPGDPKRLSRVVEIAMRESDGKMLFTPDRIEVRRNEQNSLRAQERRRPRT